MLARDAVDAGCKRLITVGGDGTFNWTFLMLITAFAIGGIFIGTALSKKIDGDRLKPFFGWFVLVMGVYIILKETLFA